MLSSDALLQHVTSNLLSTKSSKFRRTAKHHQKQPKTPNLNSPEADPAPSRKSFFDVDWKDPGAAGVERLGHQKGSC